MSKSFVFAALVMFVAFNAFAEFGGDPNGGKGGAPQRAISWDELRARCANPEQFDTQRAPQNIRIQCADSHREFVPDAPGEVPMPQARMVQTTVLSDKFYVGAMTREVPMDARDGSCMRYKEVQKDMAIERAMTCGEIMGLKGDIQDFCQSAIDQSKGSNPKLMQVHETGHFIDSCAGLSGVTEGKGGGKKQ